MLSFFVLFLKAPYFYMEKIATASDVIVSRVKYFFGFISAYFLDYYVNPFLNLLYFKSNSFLSVRLDWIYY